MLLDSSFAELEAAEIGLRNSAAVIEDGQPRLAAYYRGIGMCRDSKCPDYDADDEEWSAVRSALDAWVAEGSSLALLARVNYDMSAAWRVRGPGTSNTVSESQWAAFHALMSSAAKRFDDLPPDTRRSPLYAELALGLTKTGHLDRAFALQVYEDTRAEYPWYLPIYFQRGALAARKWGGAEGEHAEFVATEIARAHSAELGAVLYARLHWSNQRWDMFKTGRVDWKRFAGAFEELIGLYPDQWNINNFGYFACSAADPERLYAQLKRIEGVILPAWHGAEIYTDCRDQLLRFKLGSGAFEQAKQRILAGDA